MGRPNLCSGWKSSCKHKLDSWEPIPMIHESKRMNVSGANGFQLLYGSLLHQKRHSPCWYEHVEQAYFIMCLKESHRRRGQSIFFNGRSVLHHIWEVKVPDKLHRQCNYFVFPPDVRQQQEGIYGSDTPGKTRSMCGITISVHNGGHITIWYRTALSAHTGKTNFHFYNIATLLFQFCSSFIYRKKG